MATFQMVTIKVTEQWTNTHPRKPFQNTASALATTGGIVNNILCVYCKGEHYSASCEVISDTAAHSEVLRKEERCFLCLSKRHHMNQCTSSKNVEGVTRGTINQVVERMSIPVCPKSP